MSLIPEQPIDISASPPVSLDRLVRAVEKVKERLLRANSILSQAKIPFAVYEI